MLSASLFTSQAFADRTVTDQLGRQVTLPDHITRAVVLQHQTLNLLVQLNAGDDIVGVLSSWKKQLGPQFVRFMPAIEQSADAGRFNSGQYRKPAGAASAGGVRRQLRAAGDDPADPKRRDSGRRDIPASGRGGQNNKMNPTMANEEQAYNDGLKQGIRLIGEVVERQNQAEALIDYTFAARAEANAPVAGIPDSQRVRVYMARSRSQHLRLRQIYRSDDEACRGAERCGRERLRVPVRSRWNRFCSGTLR